MTKASNKAPISKRIKDTQVYMSERIGADISFDTASRELLILERKVQIYYLNGLVEDASMVELIKVLVEINDNETNKKKVFDIIENRLVNLSVEIVESMDEAVDQLLAGLNVIFVDGEQRAFVVDARNYPGRSPEEPDTERVVRGSRDGFTENVVQNTALIRRRIRDARLRNEMIQIGERSKTDVCMCYIKDITNDRVIEMAKKKLNSIEIDGITMADKALEEFIVEDKWNPFPLVRYTERPDVAANHLLEGHILIFVDTSPSVIMFPTTYFDHLEHAEEYRQTPAIGTFIRWVRLLAVMASLYLLPLWLLFVIEPSLLPASLSFIGPNEVGNIPIVIQIILADLGVEFLRMAAIHTPTSLATAMGLIAAVLIGQIAIDVGMLSPEVILYVSISTVGSYVTPSYELGVANKLVKLFLIVLTALFGLPGFVIGFTINVLFLANIRSLHVPFLWPFIPFNAGGMLHVLLRVPVPLSSRRPSVLQPKNIVRQQSKKKRS